MTLKTINNVFRPALVMIQISQRMFDPELVFGLTWFRYEMILHLTLS
jgi:hypothetical protein